MNLRVTSLPILVPQKLVRTAPAPTFDRGASDESLLLRSEAGDHAAIALLFDRYADLVLGVGLKILRDRGEAEDLVQEVFLTLFEKVRGFDPSRGAGRSWIVQIAYRRGLDRRKYLARRHFYGGTDTDSLKNALQDGPALETRLTHRITGEQLHAAFEELSERQRATLEMHFFEGCDLREISERLGETLESIRHFYYRGLDRLRKKVS